MRRFSNREIRLLGSLSWLILTITFLWMFQSSPIFYKLVWPVIFCLLIVSIAEIAIKLNISIDWCKSTGARIDLGKQMMKFSIDFNKVRKDPISITHELSKHILEIAKVNSAFVCLAPQKSLDSFVSVIPENKLLKAGIANKLIHSWDDLKHQEEAALIKVTDLWYYLVPIEINQTFYGFIGVLWDKRASAEFKENLRQDLIILAEWCAIIYEMVYAETYRARSILEVEQKRIAEEIHDFIMGRLFSAVCATSVLIRSATIAEKDREQLQLIASTVNQALRDLRSIIYSLSSTSNEKNLLQIRRYLKETEKLHGINVSLLINEDGIQIGGQQVRALYRIICEAANNAIQHGQCKSLNVEIIPDGSELCLMISDDGFGFDPQNTSNEDWGLGLSNIRKIAQSLNGFLSIESNSGQGTQMKILVPNKKTELLKMSKEEAS